MLEIDIFDQSLKNSFIFIFWGGKELDIFQDPLDDREGGAITVPDLLC